MLPCILLACPVFFNSRTLANVKRWQYVTCRRSTWRIEDRPSKLLVTYFKMMIAKILLPRHFDSFYLLSVYRNGWLVFNVVSFWLDYRGKRRRNLTRENWQRGFHCNEERYLLDAVAGVLLRTGLADCLLADFLCALYCFCDLTAELCNWLKNSSRAL